MNIRPAAGLEKRPSASLPSPETQKAEALGLAPKTEYVPDELILGMTESDLGLMSLESLEGEVVERFSFGPSLQGVSKELLRLKFGPGTDLVEQLKRLQSLPGVAYAVPNEVIRLNDEASLAEANPSKSPDAPNDLDPRLWGLHNHHNPGADISAREAWEITTGSQNGPLVAVIDSGADYHHPDLRPNISTNPGEIPDDGLDNDGNGVVDDYFGYNAYDDTGDPLDRRGHGSHCTGTIAAAGNNGIGVTGVNWNANILPVKIFNDDGVTTVDAILRGIAYAKQRGAVITSNSWGSANFNPAIFDAFASMPGLHVMAAGNSKGDIATMPSFPANFPLPNILTVGATDRQDQPAVFTNFGRTTVELFAPGHEILSTVPGGKYAYKSGTSMACPHVTGAAALVKTAFPDLGPLDLKDRLTYSTDPLSSVSQMAISGGRLNAARALSSDQTAPAAPNDFVPTSAHSKGATFSWTGTGDDKWSNGAATAFEVRVSDQPLNEESWGEAQPLSTPRGKEIGDYHHAHFTQTPQRVERTLFAGFKALDEVANRSEMVTTEVVLPSTPVVVEDDFNTADSQWSGTGRWKHTAMEGRGKVWTCQPAGPSSGTYARLTSPDYDLSDSTDSFLRFESRQDFDWDNLVYVDISNDGGESWKRLDRLQDKGRWGKREYDISEYDGQKVRIQISSETLATKPPQGTIVDNFEILGQPKKSAKGD